MEALDNLYKRLKDNNEYFIGYPCNYKYDYSELYKFLDFSINNVGDPYDTSTRYKMNSKEIEREVLKYFTKLYNNDPKDVWGYVTNGGTEGNMYGLYLAREKFPNGTVYYSNQAHYSIRKIIKLLGMTSIEIPSQSNGEMNYNVLNNVVEKKTNPVIILANLGTTMTGAYDNINAIRDIVNTKDHYIHADAALGGMLLPFLDKNFYGNYIRDINSISISGHKFIGSPIPCGIVLADRALTKDVGQSVEYVKTLDTTIMGSRDGFSPIMLYYAIQKYGDDFKRQAEKCIHMSDYLIYKFKQIGIDAWRNHNSNTVVFPIEGIDPEILDKWHIATEGNKGHIVVMQHVKRKKIKQFIKDIK